ncbi:MAG: hypothetical protein AAF958_16440 [Planctomycetota bacterium]
MNADNAASRDTAAASACPFCGIHCDDAVAVDGRFLVGCPVACRQRERAQNPQPRWDNKQLTAAEVFDLWRQAGTQDKVVSFGAAGMSLVQRLLDDPMTGRYVFVGDRERSVDVLMKSLIRESLVSATLGDVRQHADHVWLVGDIEAAFPRLGRWISPKAKIHKIKRLSESDLVRIANPRVDPLGSYLSILIGPGALGDDPNDSAVLAEMLLSRVRRHNASERSRVTLTWIDPIVSAASVYGWMTNRRLLTNRGEANIRIGSPVPGSLPVVMQLGGVDGGVQYSKGFLPAEIAGVNHDDVVTRGDGTITLPVRSEQLVDGDAGYEKTCIDWLREWALGGQTLGAGLPDA